MGGEGFTVFVITLCLFVSAILCSIILANISKKDAASADSRKTIGLILMIFSGIALFLALINVLMSLKREFLKSYIFLSLASFILLMAGMVVYKDYSDTAVKGLITTGLLLGIVSFFILYYMYSRRN